jgi:hypothetical protein
VGRPGAGQQLGPVGPSRTRPPAAGRHQQAEHHNQRHALEAPPIPGWLAGHLHGRDLPPLRPPVLSAPRGWASTPQNTRPWRPSQQDGFAQRAGKGLFHKAA